MGVEVFTKKQSENNTEINKVSGEIKSLETKKVSEEQMKEQDKVIDDATQGDPYQGKDFGKLVRHSLQRRENAKLIRISSKTNLRLIAFRQQTVITNRLFKS